MAIRKFVPTQLIPPADPVSSKQALDFVQELQKLRLQQLQEQDPVERQKLGLQIAQKVRDTPFGTLQGIARRIMMDLGKGPPYDAPGAADPRPPREAPRPSAPAKRGAKAPRGSGGKRGT